MAATVSSADVMTSSKIDSVEFYWTYTGDKHDSRQLYEPSFTAPATCQYKDILQPARSVQDVAYHLNHELEAGSSSGSSNSLAYAAINTAVEESTLQDRSNGKLLPQDSFLRDHITEDDVLVVSVGANDIALRPSWSTIFYMTTLIFSPNSWIEKGYAPGLNYFVRMFGDSVSQYIERLTSKRVPKKILVCMIYLPDHTPQESWANPILARLGYNSNPGKLELIIRRVYELGTCKIRVPGTSVIPIPLFEVLNGKDTKDYIQRVEPSVQGGRKMAKLFLQHIL
jgi:hypothetical protein